MDERAEGSPRNEPARSVLPGDRSPFRSFFMGGFECSTHRTPTGRRLDVVASSRHDVFASADYDRLRAAGLLVSREGLRWHLIETAPDELDFRTAEPMVRAARAHGVQVIWDLCHYGWPDWLDVWSPSFVASFARFAASFVRWLRERTEGPPFVTPINEISFLSWAAGEVGFFHPCGRGRGAELKQQLVRATLAAVDAMRSEEPRTRIVHTDPLINVIAHASRPQDRPLAESYRRAQFEASDMLAGRMHPELGGGEGYLDIIGLNYYHDNQWHYRTGRKIARGHPAYKPLHEMLAEWWQRYERPLFLAETGIEGAARPDWLRWVAAEVRHANASGVPVLGICLYPILNHPGWSDDRHCHNGLWDYANDTGQRPVYEPLARELRRQIRATESGVGPPSPAWHASGIALPNRTHDAPDAKQKRRT